MRLCEENPYAKHLDSSLEDIAKKMDNWIANKTAIEKEAFQIQSHNPNDGHYWFTAAFPELIGCKNIECIGGPCGRDTSKIACGAAVELEEKCIVYSIGGNNEWQFELDVLEKTPCEVHTFDCTGDIERFQVPENDRLHFHHICLGTENKVTETGEFWTLDKMTKTFKHEKIDLFKMDIEGYEFPIFQSWPLRSDRHYDTAVLPMQVLVEFHVQTHMPELSWHRKHYWKTASDLVNIQESLLKMGYVTVNRDNNRRCHHCTELTLVRARCPEVKSVK